MAAKLVKEQKKFLKLIKMERIYLYIFWNNAKTICPSITPAIQERDFIYKRCISTFKRLR